MVHILAEAAARSVRARAPRAGRAAPATPDGPARVLPRALRNPSRRRLGLDRDERRRSRRAAARLAPRLDGSRRRPGFDARVVDELDEEVPAGTPGRARRAHEPSRSPSRPATRACPRRRSRRGATSGSTRATASSATRTATSAFLDRLKDSIRRRGENISSYEVEAVLDRRIRTSRRPRSFRSPSDVGEDEVMACVVATGGSSGLDPEDADPLLRAAARVLRDPPLRRASRRAAADGRTARSRSTGSGSAASPRPPGTAMRWASPAALGPGQVVPGLPARCPPRDALTTTGPLFSLTDAITASPTRVVSSTTPAPAGSSRARCPSAARAESPRRADDVAAVGADERDHARSSTAAFAHAPYR